METHTASAVKRQESMPVSVSALYVCGNVGHNKKNDNNNDLNYG